ncbi:gamma-glutamyl kinase, partial [mine drainage metagenome]
KIIICTDVDGVFESNPKVHKKASIIPYVDRSNIDEVLKCAGPSLKIDVTGGMRTKVALLYDAIKSSNSVGYILNGSKAGTIYNFLIGKGANFTEMRW